MIRSSLAAMAFGDEFRNDQSNVLIGFVMILTSSLILNLDFTLSSMTTGSVNETMEPKTLGFLS